MKFISSNMYRTSLFRLLSFVFMLLLDVSITSSFFRTFKNSFRFFSHALGHLKCCPRFVFFFLGKQRWRSGENTCLLPMWPGWLTFLLVFSGYSGFPLSVHKNQLLPNTISNWNAQTRAYWELKAITSIELIFRDLRERGPEKGWQNVHFYEGKNDGLSTLVPPIWLTI